MVAELGMSQERLAVKKAVVLHLWVTYQIARMPDIYVMFHDRSKITVMK